MSNMMGKLSTQMTKVVVNLKLTHFKLDSKGTFPFHAKYIRVATTIYLPPESRYRRDPQQQHLCYSCAEAGHSSGLTVRGTFVHCLPTPSPHFCWWSVRWLYPELLQNQHRFGRQWSPEFCSSGEHRESCRCKAWNPVEKEKGSLVSRPERLRGRQTNGLTVMAACAIDWMAPVPWLTMWFSSRLINGSSPRSIRFKRLYMRARSEVNKRLWECFFKRLYKLNFSEYGQCKGIIQKKKKAQNFHLINWLIKLNAFDDRIDRRLKNTSSVDAVAQGSLLSADVRVEFFQIET